MTGDMTLVRRYAATRDAEALATIIRRHQGLVYGTCMRILGNHADAQDAVQECFIKFVHHAGRVQSSLPGWLHRCATHICLNVRKQALARQRREKVYSETRDAQGRGDATWKDIAPHLDRALAELPPEHGHVLVESYLRQRPATEIARELSISRAGLYRRRDEGLKLLRKRLWREGIVASAAALGTMLADSAVGAIPAETAAELGKLAGALARLPVGPRAGGRAAAPAPAGGRSMVTAAPSAKALVGVLATIALMAVFFVGVYYTVTSIERPEGPSGPQAAAPPAEPAGASAAAVPGPTRAEIAALAAEVEAIVEPATDPNAGMPRPAPAPPAEPATAAKPTTQPAKRLAAKDAEDDEDDDWHPFWITPGSQSPGGVKAPGVTAKPIVRPRGGAARAKGPYWPFAPPDVVAARALGLDLARKAAEEQAEAERRAQEKKRPRRRRPYPGIMMSVHSGSVGPDGRIVTKSGTNVSSPSK